MTTDHFGSLLSATITKEFNILSNDLKNPSAQKKFDDNQNQIYNEVNEFNILPSIISRMDNLIDDGFLDIIEEEPIAKDKFVSLHWQIKNSQLNDIVKLKVFHIYMYNEQLMNALKKYDRNFLENYFSNK